MPLSNMVGSSSPSLLQLTSPVPDDRVSQGASLSSPPRRYSSFHTPPLTRPVMSVGEVILAPSTGVVRTTVGTAPGGASTTTVTSDVAVNSPSLAVRRRT